MAGREKETRRVGRNVKLARPELPRQTLLVRRLVAIPQWRSSLVGPRALREPPSPLSARIAPSSFVQLAPCMNDVLALSLESRRPQDRKPKRSTRSCHGPVHHEAICCATRRRCRYVLFILIVFSTDAAVLNREAQKLSRSEILFRQNCEKRHPCSH